MTLWLLIAATVLGWMFGFRCYFELRAWVKQARGARILVAYKRRVVLDAPLTDWIEWANMLGQDEAARGRVVYRGGHISVAISKPRTDLPSMEVETKAVK